MTTVSGLGNTQVQSGALAASQQPAIGEEFNTFIKLLTAQVRNQDPLAPLDSTQFVEQLATFSALEQQVQSNSALGTIATMMNDMTGLLASQWLGQAVSIEASSVPYTGNAIDFSVNAPLGTERSVLTVKDSSGQAVWTETLDAGTEIHSWNGQLQSGGRATSGDVYTFSIDTYDADDVYINAVLPQVRTTVTSIRSENGILYANTSAQLVSELGRVKKV